MPEAADLSTVDLSTKQLREEARLLGADISWCLERKELIAVYKRAKQVWPEYDSASMSNVQSWDGFIDRDRSGCTGVFARSGCFTTQCVMCSYCTGVPQLPSKPVGGVH